MGDTWVLVAIVNDFTMTRENFIEFVETLRTDFLSDQSKWTNKTIDDYLEAIERYAQDIQGYYDNTGQAINVDNPDWKTFSDILKGATIYE
jgi:hypothetical protein